MKPSLGILDFRKTHIRFATFMRIFTAPSRKTVKSPVYFFCRGATNGLFKIASWIGKSTYSSFIWGKSTKCETSQSACGTHLALRSACGVHVVPRRAGLTNPMLLRVGRLGMGIHQKRYVCVCASVYIYITIL